MAALLLCKTLTFFIRRTYTKKRVQFPPKGNNFVIVNLCGRRVVAANQVWSPVVSQSPINTSELTQQDGRGKKTANLV